MKKKLRDSQVEALRYASSMIREVRELVSAERITMVEYLLDMAYLETNDILRGSRPVRPTRPVKTADRVERRRA